MSFSFRCSTCQQKAGVVRLVPHSQASRPTPWLQPSLCSYIRPHLNSRCDAPDLFLTALSTFSHHRTAQPGLSGESRERTQERGPLGPLQGQLNGGLKGLTLRTPAPACTYFCNCNSISFFRNRPLNCINSRHYKMWIGP